MDHPNLINLESANNRYYQISLSKGNKCLGVNYFLQSRTYIMRIIIKEQV